MTRIIHFSYDSVWNPWIGGGGAVRLHEIYKRLASRYEITVVASTFPGARDQTVDGVHYRFIGWGKSYAVSRVCYSLRLLGMSLLGFLTLRRYDLIVVDFDPFSFYLPLFNRAKTITEIFHLYGKHPIQKYGPLAYLVYWYERFIPARCRNRVFISESVCRQIPPNGGRTQVIYTGIESDLFDETPEEHNYILTLGRVDIYNKGLDILIPAFKRLRAEIPDARLVIAGDGKDMPALRQMIREAGLEEAVETPGRVDAAKKRELLRKSLFVVMPSRYEGWGIVAIEAAACGKATVGSNIDGLSDSIVDGQTGLLFARESVEDLHTKLRTLVQDREQRLRLGRQGRDRAKLFLWDSIAVEQQKFYEAVRQESA